MAFAAGQCWTYRAPEGFEASRLLIGAIASFDGDRTIVCAAVTNAPRRHADGHLEGMTIPFLPMTDAAFHASVVDLEGTGELPESFGEKLEAWSTDPKGLTAFTVPFDGFLDHMIAQQMAEIASLTAA
jgi:hypothetical protein